MRAKSDALSAECLLGQSVQCTQVIQIYCALSVTCVQSAACSVLSAILTGACWFVECNKRHTLTHTVLVLVSLLSTLLSILLLCPLGTLHSSRLVARLTRLFAVEFHVGSSNLLEGRAEPVVLVVV